MAMRRLIAMFTTGVLVVIAVPTVAVSASAVTFTHGVASGDVTPVSVVLWTRVDQAAALTAEVSTDPSFGFGTLRFSATATAAADFTVKVVAVPLRPNITYSYRWRQGDSLSPVGRFKTAPWPFAPAAPRFVYTGDSDGTLVGGSPFFNNFETLAAARSENPDFFVYLGDTIYADSVLRSSGPAVSLDEYRDAYKVNRGYANLTALLGATSTYAIWDDHEVYNDFDSQTVDPQRYANGHQAFLEYLPVEETLRLHDSACRTDPMFRFFRWGKDVDVIVLDERSCRGAEVKSACTFPNGALDLAPTLPARLRIQFGLPEQPPAGCLAAINDPTRTLLGGVQKDALFAVLKGSKARFKFIVNEDAIQQFFALPYDRWEGYAAERAEVLTFIRDNAIKNVSFLTTDEHAVMMNQVFIDRFVNPDPIAYEAVTGPIATFTSQQQIIAFGGAGLVTKFQAALNLVGEDCRNLDVDSYAVVSVDPATSTASITMKDRDGAVVHDQLTPSTACATTIGP
jgi:alkaline phosphatase D